MENKINLTDEQIVAIKNSILNSSANDSFSRSFRAYAFNAFGVREKEVVKITAFGSSLENAKINASRIGKKPREKGFNYVVTDCIKGREYTFELPIDILIKYGTIKSVKDIDIE